MSAGSVWSKSRDRGRSSRRARGEWRPGWSCTRTRSVRLSRRLVLEFLASSVDLSAAPRVADYLQRYDAYPERFGPPAASSERDQRKAGHHEEPAGVAAATVAQAVKIDNNLYVRDYSRCILCHKCVEACGADAQNTFAIAVAGRGFDAHISTEFTVPLPESACVYCGNCIGVCPTGALMFRSEHEMRQAGTWDKTQQTRTDTICPYCGVGCTLTLHVHSARLTEESFSSSPQDLASIESRSWAAVISLSEIVEKGNVCK